MRRFLTTGLATGLTTAALVVGVATAIPASAQPMTFGADKAHTDIVFLVKHLGFSSTIGKFEDFDVTLVFDKDAPEKSQLDVVIRPASVNTSVPPLDAHMRNKDFFDVENHPEARFVSKTIEVTGENTGKVTGDFTMLGITKPLTLDVTFNKGGIHPMKKTETVGFSARGTIKRSDYGMGYGVPAIGDNVNLIIEYEAFQ